jgi:uroporphyrinogen decarboxylase
LKPRERVLHTFTFQPADRAPYDLMEGCVWPELLDYFRQVHGVENETQVIEYLAPDFRWVFPAYTGPQAVSSPEPPPDADKSRSKAVKKGPLAGAATVAEVEAYSWPDPAWWGTGDVAAARRRWPEHALVFCPGWSPLFWGACEAFGMEEALINLVSAPHLIEAYIRKQHTFYMGLLSNCLPATGKGCDICWLGDDYASQTAMLMKPDLWRRYIKPYLAEEVQLARNRGLLVLFHSCGAVRPILPDLIEIGVNALEVFQTSARGMDAQSIARDFGGKMVFYGGIDVQKVLSSGSIADVEAAVESNLRAFKDYGGYIVANSHHSIPSIKGENILAMCRKAGQS